MKNPFPTNPSPGDIFLAGPVRISQIHGERSPRIWTLEQCRYAAHAINQHEKLVAELEQVNSEAGDAVSECNRLRDLLQTCEAAHKCLCGPLHRMQVIRAELAALLQEVTP